MAGFIAITAYLPKALASEIASDNVVNGYYDYLGEKIHYGYNVNAFTKNNTLLRQRIERLKRMEDAAKNAENITPESIRAIRTLNQEEEKSYYEHNQMIATEERGAKRTASRIGEFKYIPHSDGSIEYFKNGLVDRVLNQRVVDTFGNVSYENTYNMKYNDKRLLISYEADEKDSLGNVTHIKWQGAKYAPGSVFYATKDTNAYKNLIEYHTQETDAFGNTKRIDYKADEYSGKLTTKYTMDTYDSVYGKTHFTRSNITYIDNDPDKVKSYHEEGVSADGRSYSLDRYGITYNDKNQVTGYKETKAIYDYNGSLISKVTTEAHFTYKDVPQQFGNDVQTPDPDRLESSTITTVESNIDGSAKKETDTTYYDYDSNLNLVNAQETKEFSGQEANWYQYTDSEGHTLSRYENADGTITYSYIDPETMKQVIVSSDDVTATLKDGDLFKGTSRVKYEIVYGKPMAQQESSQTFFYGAHISDGELKRVENTVVTYENGLVDNTRRVISQESETRTSYPLIDPDGTHTGYRDIKTTYVYDENAHLIDAYGEGTGSGYEYSDTKGWYGNYTSSITVDYDVILGRALQTDYKENKDYQ